MKTKLVVVASYIGRTGSSMLMGTLKQCGFDTGTNLKSRADINNPKGYFELTTQDDLISSIFPKFYITKNVQRNGLEHAPSTNHELDEIFRLAQLNMPKFYNFMKNEFNQKQPIVIKDIRLLLLPFIYYARNDFDVRVVMLDRSIHDRVMSSLQMQFNSGVDLSTVDRQALVSSMQSWKNFGKKIKTFMPELRVLDLQFESLILDTKHAIGAIAEFIDVPRLSLLNAAKFIEAQLVKRRTLENPYMNVCYGQNGEDFVLRSLFQKLGYRGTYVDVGSLDGRVFSNTYTFELSNWHGVCVEAHPAFISHLTRNRPNAKVFHAAAMDKDYGQVEFYAYPRGSLSTIQKNEVDYLRARFKAPAAWQKVNVPGRSLNSILQEAEVNTPVDVVSIDVEGAEISVLHGFDLEKYRPRIMVLEHLTQDKKQEVAKYVKSFGYLGVTQISNNTFYCKKEDAEVVTQARNKMRVVPITTVHPLDVK